jgi:CCR4-NOT complex subunit CAF16
MAGTAEIFVQNLIYSYDPSAPPTLSDINISLPKGSRTLLIGANGGMHFACSNQWIDHSSLLAGKSTLLQILAGKRLVKSEGARILIKDRDVFRDTPPGVTYLGTEWKVLVATQWRVDMY